LLWIVYEKLWICYPTYLEYKETPENLP